MIDLTSFIDKARGIVEKAKIMAGSYRRYAGGEATPDPYGCADAANILYTIGDFPRENVHRRPFLDGLDELQGDDGLWREDTHHEIHTTAHCIAALELFDAPPRLKPEGLAHLATPDAVAGFLDGLKWRSDPWRASHQGAGLHTALTLSGMADRAWRDAYVAWLAENGDAETGLWRAGDVVPVKMRGMETRFPHLAGSFHYLFALEYERAPMPHPAALVDTCLALRADDPFPLGRTVGFAEIDWVYCLNRASRQTPHRFEEGRKALRDFAVAYADFLATAEGEEAEKLNDLHSLFGVLCALAELQRALPGFVRTEMPLRLVLDRRPFI